jgi:hypothetical protein
MEISQGESLVVSQPNTDMDIGIYTHFNSFGMLSTCHLIQFEYPMLTC